LRKKFANAAAVLLAGVLIASLLSLPGFDRFRNLDIDVLHWLESLLLPVGFMATQQNVVVVAIDEKTYATPPFKGLPKVMWTPQIAAVQSALLAADAKVVGWDVILPTSASTYLKDRRFDQPLLKSLAGERKSGRIVLGQAQLGKEPITPHRAFAMMAGGGRNIRNVDINLDDDGVSRSVPLYLELETTGGKTSKVPGLAMELAARFIGQDPVLMDNVVEFNGNRFPLVGRQGMALKFSTALDAIPTYSLADLYQCARDKRTDYFREAFEGKVVILGSVLDIEDRKLSSNRFINRADFSGAPVPCIASAITQFDYVARSTVPAVYLHATAVNNLLNGTALSLPEGIVRFLIRVLLTILVCVVVLLFGPVSATMVISFAGTFWVAASVFAFSHSQLLPILFPLLSMSLAAGSTLWYRFLVVDRDKRFLRKSFANYISPNLVDAIVDAPDGAGVSTRRQECSFVFTDLAGFTSMMERTAPEITHPIINNYIDGLVTILFEHGGTLDKIIGDAVVVMFSAPVEQSNHAQRAIDCALAMDAWARNYAVKINCEGVPFGKTRIGVNSGTVVVGNFGGSKMFDYTAYGDAINTAARLESVNKHLGTNVCISANTVDKSSTFIGRPIGELVLKGKSKGVKVYEPLSPDEMNLPNVLAYLTGYGLMEDGKHQEAIKAFTDAASDFPDDPLIAFHNNRLGHRETGTVVVMTEK